MDKIKTMKWVAAGMVAVSVMLVNGAALAAKAPQEPGSGSAQPEVFRRLGAFKEDAKKAYVFFSYDCHYCRSTSGVFDAWIQTVPRSLSVEKIPIVTGKDTAIQAAAVYAATTLDARKRPDFDLRVYGFVHDSGLPSSGLHVYLKAAVDAGYNRNDFYKAMVSDQARDFIKRSMILAQKYDVEYTPSVGIAGQYMVDAERAGGSYENMFTIMNGLVSQHFGR